MIGRNNVRRAVRRTFGVLQVKILNLHLVLTIVDEVRYAFRLYSKCLHLASARASNVEGTQEPEFQ
jgi:hypothetical protein